MKYCMGRYGQIWLDWDLYRFNLRTTHQNQTNWSHLALSFMGEKVFPNAAVDMMVMVYNFQ